MEKIALVAVGGALGAVLRYLSVGWIGRQQHLALIQVFNYLLPDHIQPRIWTIRWTNAGALMKLRNGHGQLVNCVHGQRIVGQQNVELASAIKLPHPYCILDHILGSALPEGYYARGDDTDDIKINIGRESAIQSDFLFTKILTLFQRRKIKKAEIQWLF